MHEATGGRLPPEARRVLRHVAQGLGAGAIAARLGCDRDEVCRHLADAIRTLDARSVPGAVRAAVRRGLIEPPDGEDTRVRGW